VWDDIFYPDGVGAWMAKLDADPDRGGLALSSAHACGWGWGGRG
jgi:hypothetical protein